MILRLTIIALAGLLFAAGCAPGRVADRDAEGTAGLDRGFSDIISDQRLKGRIQGFVLNDDELLDDGHVSITVFNGIVLLTGEVPDRDAGLRVAEFARRQSDARYVYNELVVADLSSIMSRSRDSVIAATARARLLTLDGLPSAFDRDRIQIVVSRGRLYLLGVIRRDEADTITDGMRRVRGVREVVRMFEYRD